LNQDAAALEIQQGRISTHLDLRRLRDGFTAATRVIDFLGLVEAAEPLSSRLLIMLNQQLR